MFSELYCSHRFVCLYSCFHHAFDIVVFVARHRNVCCDIISSVDSECKPECLTHSCLLLFTIMTCLLLYVGLLVISNKVGLCGLCIALRAFGKFSFGLFQ